MEIKGQAPGWEQQYIAQQEQGEPIASSVCWEQRQHAASFQLGVKNCSTPSCWIAAFAELGWTQHNWEESPVPHSSLVVFPWAGVKGACICLFFLCFSHLAGHTAWHRCKPSSPAAMIPACLYRLQALLQKPAREVNMKIQSWLLFYHYIFSTSLSRFAYVKNCRQNIAESRQTPEACSLSKL